MFTHKSSDPILLSIEGFLPIRLFTISPNSGIATSHFIATLFFNLLPTYNYFVVKLRKSLQTFETRITANGRSL